MEAEKVGKNVEILIKKHKMKIEDVAQKVRIDFTTFKNKINGKEEFTSEEIVQLINLFNLSSAECGKIFFCE